MKALKQVRSRLVFKSDFPGKVEYLDVTATFNMTERDFLDRNPDMQVEVANGNRLRIKKEFIAYIKEVKVVDQKVEEVKTNKNMVGTIGPH